MAAHQSVTARPGIGPDKGGTMKVYKLVKVIFFITGLILIVLSIFLFKSSSDFIKSSSTALGVIANLERDDDVYYPVVRFQTADNTEIEFMSSTGSNPPAYSAGEKVEVLFDSNNPSEAKIKSFFSMWFATLITLAIGLVFLFVSLIFKLVLSKNRDE